jgi:electron transfer flavoprotein alpha subunit
MSVLIFVEADQGKIKKSSLEALTYGKLLAAKAGVETCAVAMGEVEAAELTGLGAYGTGKVYHAADSRFNDGNIQATSVLIGAVAEEVGATTILMARSSLVDAVAARVAVKTGASVVTNVVSLPEEGGDFVVKRGVYTGKAFATVAIKSAKKVLTLAKNAVAPQKVEGTATVVTYKAPVTDADFAVKRLNVTKAEGDILLPEADRVVSGGRGLKGPENWGMIEELAKTLGAATACSKPVSDMDWRPHHEHVGQTGIKVSPDLYIAVGISGAIQHLAGVNSSRVIVAINKDAEAPFFKAADYGIVGDAFEVIPKLTQAIKELA